MIELNWKHTMRNTGLGESQAGIKITGRNTNNCRYTDDTTLIAESEKELKSLLMSVKEDREKAYLKLHDQKTKIMASGPIASRQIGGKKVEIVTDFIFLQWEPSQLIKNPPAMQEILVGFLGWEDPLEKG